MFKAVDLVHVAKIGDLIDLIIDAHYRDLLIPGAVHDGPLAGSRDRPPVPPHHRLTFINFCGWLSVYDREPSGVKIQDQFLDHGAFSRAAPSFKDNDYRQFLFFDRTIQCCQLLFQRIYFCAVFFIRDDFVQINFLKHGKPPPVIIFCIPCNHHSMFEQILPSSFVCAWENLL